MGKNAIRPNKKAAQDLITEKEKLTLVINSLMDGLIILDRQGVIIMVNPQAEKYFNITKKEVLGKKIKETVLEDCLYDLFKRIKKSASKRAITKEMPVFDGHKQESFFAAHFIKITEAKKASSFAGATVGRHSFERRHADKSENKEERFLHITAKAMVNAKNVITGCILTAHDITREKTVERLKNEFISISAHQLLTPLSAVK
ncbi:PAS domain-containing protein, partial [Candidatus Parcubacteria bacterium]|nr:PAS domain-containing protein [Candidatus Parcubacteria bacterium]